MLKRIRAFMAAGGGNGPSSGTGTGHGGPDRYSERATINRVIVGIITFGALALLGIIASGIVEQVTGRPMSDVTQNQLGSIVTVALGALAAMLTRTSTPGSDPPQKVEIEQPPGDPIPVTETAAAAPARPPVEVQGQNRPVSHPGALPPSQGDSAPPSPGVTITFPAPVPGMPPPPLPAERVFDSQRDAGEIVY